MSENLPYEDQIRRQFEEDGDLSLPEMDQSWQKMKSLLHEDKKRRLLPPLFLNGCITIFFITGIITIIWLLLHTPGKTNDNLQKNDKKSGETSTTTTVINANKTVQDTILNLGSKDKKQNVTAKNANNLQVESEDKHHPTGTGALNEISTYTQGKTQKVFTNSAVTVGNSLTKHTENSKTSTKLKKSSQLTFEIGTHRKRNNVDKGSAFLTNTGSTNAGTRNGLKKVENDMGKLENKNSDAQLEVVPEQKRETDSSLLKKADRKDAIPILVVKPKGKEAVDKDAKEHYFAAGLALQQQIPLSGQKAVPFNVYGRTGSLADYIPSVYGRFYRANKWFLQAEFRYGAPQNTKQLDYSKQKIDSFGATVTRRSLQLKKTYYHQIPVTFNYFVLRDLSVGAGLMYSKFYGAVSEEQITNTNLLTNRDSVIKKSVIKIPAARDSFFTKSQLHAIFEAQYQWKNLSAGFRYTWGLQPFIKYTTAAGAEKSEKNHSLQVFLRYELWQSKKKK